MNFKSHLLVLLTLVLSFIEDSQRNPIIRDFNHQLFLHSNEALRPTIQQYHTLTGLQHYQEENDDQLL